MAKPIITNVEMAKNLVEMTYDAPSVYEDEFEGDIDCEFKRFQKLFGRDKHMYFNDAECELVQGQLYNVFWCIKLVRFGENPLSDENEVAREHHLIHNPIYDETKWKNERESGQSRCVKFEHINQVYVLREGLKRYLRK